MAKEELNCIDTITNGGQVIGYVCIDRYGCAKRFTVEQMHSILDMQSKVVRGLSLTTNGQIMYVPKKQTDFKLVLGAERTGLFNDYVAEGNMTGCSYFVYPELVGNRVDVKAGVVLNAMEFCKLRDTKRVGFIDERVYGLTTDSLPERRIRGMSWYMFALEFIKDLCMRYEVSNGVISAIALHAGSVTLPNIVGGSVMRNTAGKMECFILRLVNYSGQVWHRLVFVPQKSFCFVSAPIYANGSSKAAVLGSFMNMGAQVQNLCIEPKGGLEGLKDFVVGLNSSLIGGYKHD